VKYTTGNRVLFEHKGDRMRGEVVGYTQLFDGNRVYHIKVDDGNHMVMCYNVTEKEIRSILILS
jgi:phage terminase large subunit GpA-like protein